MDKNSEVLKFVSIFLTAGQDGNEEEIQRLLKEGSSQTVTYSELAEVILANNFGIEQEFYEKDRNLDLLIEGLVHVGVLSEAQIDDLAKFIENEKGEK